MAHTKIRLDQHGVYVRIGGHVCRPQPGAWDQRHEVLCGHALETKMREHDVVYVRHLSQTTTCLVRRLADSEEERWTNHGMYVGPAQLPSWMCWTPRLI